MDMRSHKHSGSHSKPRSEGASASGRRDQSRGMRRQGHWRDTFNPLDFEGYYKAVDDLYSYMKDCKEDREVEAATSSSFNGQVPMAAGMDLISGHWRELRLNFRMGMNRQLEQHGVRAPISSHSRSRVL